MNRLGSADSFSRFATTGKNARQGDSPPPGNLNHASLNRHDLFTLRGITAHPEGISYPTILGNDAAGTLDDGTVVIYPMMGSADWRGDETLDPAWHIPSEFIPGTFAHCAIVPKRNAISLPARLSPLHASVLGFTKSGLRAGQTVLVQGATGGMATALIQLGRAAGGQDALADVRDKVERVAQVAFDRLARSIDHAWAAWHKTITSDRYDDEVEPSARKRAKLGNPRWACHAFARNFIIPIFLNSPAQPIIADTACAIVITATR